MVKTGKQRVLSKVTTLGRRSASGELDDNSSKTNYLRDRLDEEPGKKKMTSSGLMESAESAEPAKATTAVVQVQVQVPGFFSPTSLEIYASWLAELDRFSNDTAISEDQLESLLGTLQQARNKIIGNKDVKRLLVSQRIVPRLAGILKRRSRSQSDDVDRLLVSCQRECAVMIGSLVLASESEGIISSQQETIQIYQEEEQVELVGAMLQIVCAHRDGDQLGLGLLEAVLRAMRTLCRRPGLHRALPYDATALPALLALMQRGAVERESVQWQNVCQYTGSILANGCDGEAKQRALLAAGALEMGAGLLGSALLKHVETGLDLLAALCRDNRAAASRLAGLHQPVLPLVLDMCAGHGRPEVRLLAALLLTNMHRAQGLPSEADVVPRIVLPSLVQLLRVSGEQRGSGLSTLVQVRAPLVLAFLLSGEEALQLAALGCNAVGELSSLLEAMEAMEGSQAEQEYASPVPDMRRRMQEQACENGLIALAALTASRDECRRLVLEERPAVLRIAVRLLGSKQAGLRTAACQCIRSLSRSVKNLRTHLVDANIVGHLVKLLEAGEEVQVQTAACATLCNMVLDFAPMKAVVLGSGALDRIASLLASPDAGLRLNAVWAVKNLLYIADAPTKQAVMQRISFPLLHDLTRDPEGDIQAQALNILRNLACGDDSVSLYGECNNLMYHLNRILCRSCRASGPSAS